MSERVDYANFLRNQLQITLGALSDISVSSDMTLAMARRKARRIYEDVRMAVLTKETEYLAAAEPEGKS